MLFTSTTRNAGLRQSSVLSASYHPVLIYERTIATCLPLWAVVDVFVGAWLERKTYCVRSVLLIKTWKWKKTPTNLAIREKKQNYVIYLKLKGYYEIEQMDH